VSRTNNNALEGVSSDIGREYSEYLTQEETNNLSQVSKSAHHALGSTKQARENHCYRVTQAGVGCFELIANDLVLNSECFGFCERHSRKALCNTLDVLVQTKIDVEFKNESGETKIFTLSLNSGRITNEQPEAILRLRFENGNLVIDNDLNFTSFSWNKSFAHALTILKSNLRNNAEVLLYFSLPFEEMQGFTRIQRLLRAYSVSKGFEVSLNLANFEVKSRHVDIVMCRIELVGRPASMLALEPAEPEVMSEDSDDSEESQEESDCDYADCIDIVRGSVLDPRCVRYCKESMNEAMSDVLKLLTHTSIFVQDRDGFSYKVSTNWRLVVENQESETLLLMESQYDNGEDAAQHVDFKSPEWSRVVIYYDKNAERKLPLENMGQAPLVAMWAETPDGSVYIKHFHETSAYVIVEIANPLNMDTPD
jgi:hypothetical protein